MKHEHQHAPSRGWGEKFADAFRGLKLGIRSQVSFYVHFFAALLVLGAGFLFHLNSHEWCILAVCVTIVFTAEMLNTAIEMLARAITDQVDPNIGAALDIGSAAVLLAAIGAAVVGSIVFLNQVNRLLGLWSGG